MFTSRFRFSENDFTLQRTELETVASFGRWTTTVMYGNYAAQPADRVPQPPRGCPRHCTAEDERRTGCCLGGRDTISMPNRSAQTQVGLGYIDDCLILALNYITNYAYSGSVSVNHTYMMQVSLRTLGGSASTNSGAAGLGPAPGAFGATH